MIDRHIIAIDPGKKTGMASLTFNVEGEQLAFVCGEGDLLGCMEWIESIAVVYPEIVIEDFIYTAATAQKTRQTWSTEGIGMARYITHKFNLDFVIQSPASAKKFSTDDKLKKIGWYFPSKGGHRNDAARHLLLYCVNQKLIDPRILI